MDQETQFRLEYGAARGGEVRVLATLSRSPGMLVKTEVVAKVRGDAGAPLALLQILFLGALDQWAKMLDSGAVLRHVDSGVPAKREDDPGESGSRSIIRPA